MWALPGDPRYAVETASFRCGACQHGRAPAYCRKAGLSPPFGGLVTEPLDSVALERPHFWGRPEGLVRDFAVALYLPWLGGGDCARCDGAERMRHW